jgi:hypothetical protein
MPDPQVIDAMSGEAGAHAEDNGAEAATSAPARDVQRDIPVLRLVETVRAPQTAEPFDDLQPMLDLRFPEAPADNESGARDESIAAQEDQPGAVALAEQTTALTADALESAPAVLHAETPEVLAEVVADAPLAAAGDDAAGAQPPVELVAHDLDPPADTDHSAPTAADSDVPAGADDRHTPEWDAAQQIASEADATAQALENLKHLIAHRMPGIEPDALASPPDDEDRAQPPPIQAFAAPPPAALADDAEHDLHLEPIELAVIADEAHHARRGRAWPGFLAGFMASWAIGAALYAYLVFA